MNARGHYGTVHVGQAIPAPAVIYVEQESSSIWGWIFGTAAVGGVLLWARHQAAQVERLYRKADLPYHGFASSLRESATSSIRAFADRACPRRKDTST